jgi:hypothetical protein
MAKAFGTYVAILDHTEARALLRIRATALELPTGVAPARPRQGDRLGILAVRGPLFVAGAAFVGTADVLSDEGSLLRLRHRVLAPEPYQIALGRLPSLRVSAGWTHRSLGELRGTAVRCSSRDLERVEAALLTLARRHGPAPKRPAHRRPRTPGRRALIAGRAAVGRRP